MTSSERVRVMPTRVEIRDVERMDVDPPRGTDGRRSVHVHVPQRRRARVAHDQARHRGSVALTVASQRMPASK